MGEKVDAKIVAVDKASRKLSLTIKGKEVEEEKQAMAEFGSSDSGASLGDILGAAIRRRNQQAQPEAVPRSVGVTRHPSSRPERMTLETDLLLDRRRLKRRLVFWRSLAVLAVLVAVLVALRGADLGSAVIAGRSGWLSQRHHHRGPQAGRAVDKLADNSSVKALIVSIDSPGGSVAGGEALHDAIARVAAKKPVVAVMGGWRRRPVT